MSTGRQSGTDRSQQNAQSNSIRTGETSSTQNSRQQKETRHGYHLWMKRPAVKSCYGCKQTFADCYSKPPKDVIIRRFMMRQYKDKKTGLVTKSSKVSAAYFHLNMDCIRKVTPRVNMKDLFIHDEVWPHLNQERLTRLQKLGLQLFPNEDDI